MSKEEILQQQIKLLKEEIETLRGEKKSLEVDIYNLENDVSFVQRCRSDDQVEKRVAKSNFRMMFILFVVELIFILIKL